MYLCVCHAFTDGVVRRLAPECDGTVSDFYRALGVSPTCGKCVPFVRDLVRETHPRQLTAPAPAA